MRKPNQILIFTLLSQIAFCQINLVPNPSFEQYSQCPISTSGIEYAINWFNPTQHSPDYFNTCSISGDYSIPNNFFGVQTAKTGSAYVGIGTACYNGHREYISTQLIDTLESGKTYHVEFFLSLSDSSNYATDDIGIYFSNTPMNVNTIDSLNLSPQFENQEGNLLNDKINWYKIQTTYIATGGELFIILGNFKGSKTTDSVFVNNGGELSNPNYSGAYYYLDDVSVVDSTSTSIKELKDNKGFYIKQTNDELKIILNDKTQNIQIIDTQGKMVYSNNIITTNYLTISIDNFTTGIYVIRVLQNSKVKTQKILIQ